MGRAILASRSLGQLKLNPSWFRVEPGGGEECVELSRWALEVGRPPSRQIYDFHPLKCCLPKPS